MAMSFRNHADPGACLDYGKRESAQEFGRLAASLTNATSAESWGIG